MTDVLFVRHGRTPWSDLGRVQGRTDTRLNSNGRAEMLRLLPSIVDWTPEAIYSSPIQRARESAELLGKGLGLHIAICEGLAELDVGEWTGKTGDELLEVSESWREYLRNPTAAAPAGGESFEHLIKRVLSAMDVIHGAGHGRVVVVSHADVIRIAISSCIGLPLERMRSLHIGLGAMSLLTSSSGQPRLDLLNCPVLLTDAG